MPDAPRIFYSWQSQLPNSTTRGFIGDALDKAAKALVADATVEELPDILQGAGDAAGAPNIAETIFQHIDEADAIVFDVSLVPTGHRREGEDVRPAPNANVLVELGYALRSTGLHSDDEHGRHKRIILVMNTAYGPREALPFDFKFRRILMYELREGEEKAELRKGVVSELQKRLGAILALGKRDTPRVGLDVTWKRTTNHPRAHDYVMQIVLTNTSERRIADYHVDLSLPAGAFSAIGISNTAYVSNRSTRDTAFLRYVGREPLNVGDPFINQVPYRITEAMYNDNPSKVRSWAARAVAYVDGVSVAEQTLQPIHEF